MKRKIFFLSVCVILISLPYTSCKVSYSFTGASISTNIKTFSVAYFPNRARLINPNLSQLLTDGLQDKIIKQSSLSQISSNGDLEFSGQITDYEQKAVNISTGDVAAQMRLTIGVKVKFVDNKDHTQDWEKSFTAYEDFSSSQTLSSVEDSLVPEIIKKLTDDIFNASVANW
jgi:hypothetical protein